MNKKKLKCTIRNCHGTMKFSKAMRSTTTGIPDFMGDKYPVTLSAGGPGTLIECLKCDKCGHSIGIIKEK